jgi:hypothetical protein
METRTQGLKSLRENSDYRRRVWRGFEAASKRSYSDRRTIGRPYKIRSAVMTFGAGLTVPSFDLVVLRLTTGPVFLPASTFFSMATVSSPNFDLAAFRIII